MNRGLVRHFSTLRFRQGTLKQGGAQQVPKPVETLAASGAFLYASLPVSFLSKSLKHRRNPRLFHDNEALTPWA
jgi:hypothetical protein